MRHKVNQQLKFNHKDKDHRKAALKNLLTSFFVHKSLIVTQKRAKAIAMFVDKLVNVVNTKDKMNAIRFVSRYLFTKESSLELFNNVAPKYTKNKSWITRVTPIKLRIWDGAKLVKIELI